MQDLKTAPIVASDILLTLRDLVDSIDALKRFVGPIADFHVVIDANVIIREILWRLEKRGSPSARTRLHEAIQAGTIIAYATTRVIVEAQEHLARLVVERGHPAGIHLEEWENFHALLEIKDVGDDFIEKYRHGQDPDDAPTLALADMLTAAGILSYDTDIAAMGGKVLPIEFLVEARDYSRQAAVAVSIKVSGYYLTLGSVYAVKLSIDCLASIGRAVLALPPAAKVALFLIAVTVIAHPALRKSLVATLAKPRRPMATAATSVLEFACKIAELSAANPAVAPVITSAKHR